MRSQIHGASLLQSLSTIEQYIHRMLSEVVITMIPSPTEQPQQPESLRCFLRHHSRNQKSCHVYLISGLVKSPSTIVPIHRTARQSWQTQTSVKRHREMLVTIRAPRRARYASILAISSLSIFTLVGRVPPIIYESPCEAAEPGSNINCLSQISTNNK